VPKPVFAGAGERPPGQQVFSSFGTVNYHVWIALFLNFQSMDILQRENDKIISYYKTEM
jgi:hypothetical protein